MEPPRREPEELPLPPKTERQQKRIIGYDHIRPTPIEAVPPGCEDEIETGWFLCYKYLVPVIAVIHCSAAFYLMDFSFFFPFQSNSASLLDPSDIRKRFILHVLAFPLIYGGQWIGGTMGAMLAELFNGVLWGYAFVGLAHKLTLAATRKRPMGPD